MVVIRAYAPGTTGGQLRIYVSDGDWTSGAALDVPLSTLSDGWTDIEMPIGSALGHFDPSQTIQVTLEIESGSSGPWTDPTVIYIDSIRSLEKHLNDSFDTDIGTILRSTFRVVAGSTESWLDAA